MAPAFRRATLVGGAAALVLALLCLCGYLYTGPGPGQLNYKIFHKKTLMTFAYKAYASERTADGKYWMARLVLENTGGQSLKGVKVSYRIPEYMDWTTPDESAELLPGQTKVFAIYPKLPAKVTQTRSRTPATVEFRLAYTDHRGKEIEKVEKREFEFRGVNEIEYSSLPDSEIVDWYDVFSNNEIIAAYVTDEDDVVKQYLGKISETQGGVGIINNQKDLLTFLKSCYDFQVKTGMTYAAAKSVPEKIGDTTALVQSIRLPRDVIQQNSGLCIELAILQAALAQAAGAKAYLVLVPGHCYPVIQATDGSMVAIESTGVGGANLGGVSPFEKAVEAGMKQFQQVQKGEIPSCIVDVGMQHARGLRPPELDRIESSAIAKLLSDRVTQQGNQVLVDHRQGGQGGQGNQQAGGGVMPPPDQGGGGGGGMPPPDGGGMAMASFRGNLAAMPYPANFMSNPQALAQVRQFAPFYASSAMDPQQTTGIDVFEFNSNNPDECVQALVNFGGQVGYQYSLAAPQPTPIAGQPGVIYPFQGMSQMTGVRFQGVIMFVKTQQGTLGVGIWGVAGSNEWARLQQAVAAQTRMGGAQ